MYDKLFKSLVAIGGATASYLFGGWNVLIQTLLLFVAIDYLTGCIAAGYKGKLSSAIGFKGIAKKVFIFLVVAIAHQVDKMLGDAHLFRDATIFFYLANEVLSIVENGGVMGVKFPPVMQKAISVLQNKGGVE